MTYKIAHKSTRSEFMWEVAVFIEQGYVPLGGVSFNAGWWTQALTYMEPIAKESQHDASD